MDAMPQTLVRDAAPGYPMPLCGDHIAFEREWAGKDPKTRPDWPLPSMLAPDWAEAFCKTFVVSRIAGTKPEADQEGLMIAWFACALERGRDEGRRHAVPVAS